MIYVKSKINLAIFYSLRLGEVETLLWMQNLSWLITTTVKFIGIAPWLGTTRTSSIIIIQPFLLLQFYNRQLLRKEK